MHNVVKEINIMMMKRFDCNDDDGCCDSSDDDDNDDE